MTKNGLYDFRLEFTQESDHMEELDRQLSVLLSTVEGTVPLDRELGLNTDFADKPPQLAKTLYTAEVTKKVAKFIPSVRVREITWSQPEDGKLIPRVVITNA